MANERMQQRQTETTLLSMFDDCLSCLHHWILIISVENFLEKRSIVRYDTGGNGMKIKLEICACITRFAYDPSASSGEELKFKIYKNWIKRQQNVS
jgi:hypothetical protein